MRRKVTICIIGGLFLGVAVSTYSTWGQYLPGFRSTPEKDQVHSTGRPSALASTRPKLPETAPPRELRTKIVAWGQRDYFPTIRDPQYVSAEEGDRLLAPDEPVLGFVLQGEARAYSTNQLNDHEMVLDEIVGVPVLVTY